MMSAVKLNIVIFIIFIMFSSCIPRNKSGYVRVNRPSLQKFENRISSMIDTTALYHCVMFDGQTQSSYNSVEPIKEKNIFLKFYGDGKVGRFNKLDTINLETINPKNATMGYYCSNSNGNNISLVSYHVQSGVRVIHYQYKTSNDTLIEYRHEEYSNKLRTITYIKRDINPALLVYKPDW